MPAPGNKQFSNTTRLVSLLYNGFRNRIPNILFEEF
jgi:hypothetical protein